MRILLSNFHRGYGGGHDTYISTLVKALAPQHEITIAVPGGSHLYKQLHTEYDCLAIDYKFRLNRLPAFTKNICKLQKLMKQRPYDIVHVNGSMDHTTFILVNSLLSKKSKLIFTKHNSLPIHTGAHLRMRYFTDGIIAVSNFTQQQLPDSIRKNTKVRVIPNGVDVNYYTPVSREQKIILRKKYNLTPEDFVFVSVAGTPDYKGWALMLEAIEKLPPELRKKVKVMIAGVRPSDAVVQHWSQRLGLPAEQIFPGLLSDVREIIAVGDVGFVLSYAVETISFACREMMSMGLPMMVSAYAGLPENVNAEQNGWILPVKDVQAIQNCLMKILTKEEVSTMGMHAREKAINSFSNEQFVKNTVDFYQEVLA